MVQTPLASKYPMISNDLPDDEEVGDVVEVRSKYPGEPQRQQEALTREHNVLQNGVIKFLTNADIGSRTG